MSTYTDVSKKQLFDALTELVKAITVLVQAEAKNRRA